MTERVANRLDVSSRDTTLIVSMSLVISGIATYVPIDGLGNLGGKGSSRYLDPVIKYALFDVLDEDIDGDPEGQAGTG